MGNGILGIDIGRSGIKAVQVAVGMKGRCRITAAEDYDFRTYGDLSAVLEKIRGEERFRESVCITALPAELFSFRNLQMPFREQRKIRQTLDFELEPLLPFPIADVATDFTVVERNGGSDILAAAVSREAIAGRLGLLEPFRVSLIDVDSVPLAMHLVAGAALGRAAAQSNQTCFVLLDIGAGGTTAVFFRRGKIFQIRTFSFGGDTITAAVQDALKIDFEEAERRKRSGLDATADRAAGGEIARRCEKFCQELDHTLQFLKLRRSDERPSKVFVTGGGALCERLIESLHGYFSLPVERVDLRQIRPVSIPPEMSAGWSPLKMNGALALALRGGGKAEGFNLNRDAHETARYLRFVRGNVRQIAAVLAIVFGILAFDSAAGYFIDQRRLAHLKAESERILKTASPEITRVVDPVQQLKTKIAEAKKYAVSGAGAEVGFLDLLKKLSEAVPATVSFQITDLNYDGDRIDIRGETSDFDTVETIKRGIAAAGYFKNVSVSGANLVKEKNRVEFEVRMTCAR